MSPLSYSMYLSTVNPSVVCLKFILCLFDVHLSSIIDSRMGKQGSSL